MVRELGEVLGRGVGSKVEQGGAPEEVQGQEGSSPEGVSCCRRFGQHGAVGGGE